MPTSPSSRAGGVWRTSKIRWRGGFSSKAVVEALQKALNAVRLLRAVFFGKVLSMYCAHRGIVIFVQAGQTDDDKRVSHSATAGAWCVYLFWWSRLFCIMQLFHKSGPFQRVYLATAKADCTICFITPVRDATKARGIKKWSKKMRCLHYWRVTHNMYTYIHGHLRAMLTSRIRSSLLVFDACAPLALPLPLLFHSGMCARVYWVSALWCVCECVCSSRYVATQTFTHAYYVVIDRDRCYSWHIPLSCKLLLLLLFSVCILRICISFLHAL